MTSNESKAKANLIWDKLFSISNEGKTKSEQIDMIESVLIEVAKDQRAVGRMAAVNSIKTSLQEYSDFYDPKK